MGEDLRGVALSMLRPVSASILTKKGTLIIIQVQLEISFDISDEFDFIDRIFFFFFRICDSMEEKRYVFR